MNSIHVLLSLAINMDWFIHHLDFSTTFLYSDLAEQVFMKQPLGYIAPKETFQVCLLRLAIYGLKQSLCVWFVKFSGKLKAYGFNPCKFDLIVMSKTTSLGCRVLAMYVDDIILIGTTRMVSLLPKLIFKCTLQHVTCRHRDISLGLSLLTN